MPCRRNVPSLIELSLGSVVRYISNCSAIVTAHSYWLSTHHLANDNGAAERRSNAYIDKAVEGLRAHLFSLVPWHHYQALVDLYMAWLTQAVHQSKAIYRRSNSPPETVHHAHVLVRFVHLVVHPRLRSLDLSTLPKVQQKPNSLLLLNKNQRFCGTTSTDSSANLQACRNFTWAAAVGKR